MPPAEITIALSEIAGEALCSVEVNEIGPNDSTDSGQIVERTEGKLAIVDGFHRTVGQIVYCRENGIDPKAYLITVILACDDADADAEGVDGDMMDLVEAASMPSDEQGEAIERIYEMAGR